LPCKLGMSAQFAITMKIGDVCAEFHLSWIVRGPMPVWHMLLYVPLLGTYRIVRRIYMLFYTCGIRWLDSWCYHNGCIIKYNGLRDEINFGRLYL
jgi:hypothetical protein